MSENETAPTEGATEIAPPAAPASRTIAGGGEYDLSAARNAIAVGAMTAEEASQHWSLTPEEVKALSSPQSAVKGGVKSVETELAELRALRTTDPKRYWGAEAQKRQLELIEKQQARAAGTIVGEATTSLNEVEAELKKIADLRRSDRAAYNRDSAMQARERELLGEKDALVAEVTTVENLHEIAGAVMETAADQAAFEKDFDGMYGGLSEEGRYALRAELGSAPSEPARPANEEQVANFSSVPIGAELAAEWGRNTPKKIAMIHSRVNRAFPNTADLVRALDYFDSLPPETAKQIARKLAR